LCGLLAAAILLPTTSAAEPAARAAPPNSISAIRPRPDLAFATQITVHQDMGGPAVTQVDGARTFYVCYRVRNTGALASGAFSVGAQWPYPLWHVRQHSALAPGATSSGCLSLKSPVFEPPFGPDPEPQNFAASLHIDVGDAVNESNENNNSDGWAVMGVWD
jgi:hypothetical protein